MLRSWLDGIIDNRISSLNKKIDEITENMTVLIKNAYTLSLLVKENRNTLELVLKVQTALVNELAPKPTNKKLLTLASSTSVTDDDDLIN